MIPVLVLLVIALLYFHPFLSGKLIFIERDLSVFFIPPRYLWVKMVKDLEFPLWNPHQYSGIPLFATLQPGVLYPPHLFYLILPFNIVWNYLIILHFFFSGITTYFFMRYMGGSKIASFLAGTVFMLSGYTLSVHNLIPHLFSVSWFPLVLLFFLKSLKEGRKTSRVFASFCLTMQYLSGAPEVVLMTLVVLSVLYFISSRKDLLSGGKVLLQIFLLFILLCAVQLLPFFELHLASIRKGGLSYEEATTWSFAWKDFLLFFMPDAYNYFADETRYWKNQAWLKTVYIGFAPILLTIFYFLSQDKRRYVVLLFMVISFIFALGKHTPLYKLIYHVPPFGSVRYPVKFLFLFFFCISFTSCFGFDVLREKIKERRFSSAARFFFYLGFAFFISFFYIVFFKDDVRNAFYQIGFAPDRFHDVDFNIHNLRRFFFFAFLFSILPFIYLNIKAKRPVLYFMVLVAGADLFLANYGYCAHAPWEFYIQKTPLIEKMSQEGTLGRYFLTPRTSEQYKFFPRNKIAPGPYFAQVFGLYSIDGSEVMRICWHDVILNTINAMPSFSAAKRLLEISGVKYVISSKEIDDKDVKELEKIESSGEFVRLYSLNSFLRAEIMGAKIAKTDIDALNMILDPKFGYTSFIVIVDGTESSPERMPTKGSIKIMEYSPHRILIEAYSEKEAYLYLSDTFYPGWKAYVNGKQVRILRANVAFRAVPIPKGDSLVEFVYKPLSFYIGLILSFLGSVFSLLCLYFDRREKSEKFKDRT
ncbi:MAG: YfhO family protein [Desulfobacterota bacterium]|nr:YfhO family protein [Thermodesulfobacteriota bacterium]